MLTTNAAITGYWKRYVTMEELYTWKKPDFQRGFFLNQKVKAAVIEIKKKGEIPGIISLGFLSSDPTVLYVYNGQHRVEAAKLTGLEGFIVEGHQNEFETMEEMAQAYLDLNTQYVKMRPDDDLKAAEGHLPALQTIRRLCPFVGYDNVRRGPSNYKLAMNFVLRTWRISRNNSPVTFGGNTLTYAKLLGEDGAVPLCDFLNIARTVWGWEKEYSRLWGALNLTICAWIWRRMVLDDAEERTHLNIGEHTLLTPEEFKHGMAALTTVPSYIEFLKNKNLHELHRSPCFNRMKEIMQTAFHNELGRRPRFPKADWIEKKR